MQEGHDIKAPADSDVVITLDPVCGMTVDPGVGKPTQDHGGHIYYFCSASCRDKFAAAPAGRHEVHLPDASGDHPGRIR